MDGVARTIADETLQRLGLYPAQIARALADSRISWTEATIAACVAYVKASTAERPAAALWANYLQHGRTPPALKVAAAPAPDVPPCPACGGPVDQCGGLHGWAAAYRAEVLAVWSGEVRP